MSVIDEFVKRDLFAQHIAVEVSEVKDGCARAQMKITSKHLNSAGTVHGGAIFALADAAFSAASNSHGTIAMAIEASISYFKAVRSGTLYATAKEVSKTPKLGTYIIEITDEQGNTVALFKGTVYRKATPIEEVIHS